jgi:hypothetical protein
VLRGGRGRVQRSCSEICVIISYNVIVETCRLLYRLVFRVTARTGFMNKRKQMKVTVCCIDIVHGS